MITLACSIIGIALVLAGIKHEERQERKTQLYQTGGITFFIGGKYLNNLIHFFSFFNIKSLLYSLVEII